MRYLSLGALALAATMSMGGAAYALDETSLGAADAEAADAQMAVAPAPSRSLGYSQTERSAHPLAVMPATAYPTAPNTAPRTVDEANLRLGDRGIGNE